MFYQLSAMENRRKTRGFTRIDLLLVVIVITVVMALVLPACMPVFDLASRDGCTHKLQSIAKACSFFEENYGNLPPGVTSCATKEWRYRSTGKIPCQGPNWMTAILRFVDEQNHHDALQDCMMDKCTVCIDCPPWTKEYSEGLGGEGVGTRTPKIYLCPGARSGLADFNLNAGEMPGLSKASYAGCFGGDYYKPSQKEFRGPFGVEPSPRASFNQATSGTRWEFKPIEEQYFDACTARAKGLWKNSFGRGVKIVDIKDGTATTVMVSEVVGAESQQDGRGAWMWPGMGGAAYTAKNGPNSSDPDGLALCDAEVATGSGGRCEDAEDTLTHGAARSMHWGGVNVAYVDQGTRFISNNIDMSVWRALSTVRGQEGGDIPKSPE